MAAAEAQRLLYVLRRSPYDSLRPLETIDAILVAAVFELSVGVLFLEDAVWQLVPPQRSAPATKNIAQQLSVLPTYEVESIWVCTESLRQRGLNSSDLVLPVTTVTMEQQQALLNSYPVVLND
ncbi:MAG: sulfurtransferase complex subunit TusC [Pseudomonadales bacterium]